MKSLFAETLLVCLFAAGISAAADDVKPPKIGEQAPPLDVQTLMQAPAGAQASWDAMRGKVVVLEFWATWCAPCVGAISHMNELADAFKNRPVQFIAITDEDEATIKEFLAKKPIHGWVGLNANKSMSNSYAVEAIPLTVIVGTDGKIAAITHPNHVEARHVENVLAGRDSGLPPSTDDDDKPTVSANRPPGEEKEEQPAVFQFVIRPSKGDASGWTSGRAGTNDFGIIYESKALGVALSNLVTSMYGVSGSRLIFESPLPEGRFDVLFRSPHDNLKEMEAVRRQVIEATFGLTSRRESRELDVYVLTVKVPGAKGLQPTAISSQGSSMHAAKGRFEAVNCTIDSWVKSSLEHQLKKPVFDETGLKDGYDIELKWEAGEEPVAGTDKLISAVREQLGLELTLTKRPVEVVVVSRRPKP
jgi:uncharacterized protein (TIGR03435 family)